MRQNSLGSCATFSAVVTQASPQTEAADHPVTALNYFRNWKSHDQIKKRKENSYLKVTSFQNSLNSFNQKLARNTIWSKE